MAGRGTPNANDYRDAYRDNALNKLANDPNLSTRERYELERRLERIDANLPPNPAPNNPRSNAGSYYSYKELRKTIKKAYLSGRNRGFEAHHLLEKQFANAFGVNKNDIISVALTPLHHRGVAGVQVIGVGSNIDSQITTKLQNIMGSKDISNATPEQIWRAHRDVYTSLGQTTWAEAVYNTYVRPMGIKY